MNIEEYRAMVAAEKEQESAPPAEPETQPETVVETTPPEPEAPPAPSALVVDDEEFTPETIRQLKLGNLRNDDYTRKSQELASLRREAQAAIEFFNHVKQNPTLSQQLLEVDQSPVVQRLNPHIERQARTEQELWDLKVQQEIRDMTDKYGAEFDANIAMQMAVNKNLNNLDDAWQFVMFERSRQADNVSRQSSTPPAQATPTVPQSTPPIDMEQLRAEMRAALLQEIEAERVGTQTIISSTGNTPVGQTTEIALSPEEAKMAKIYGMTPQEWVKWNTHE